MYGLEHSPLEPWPFTAQETPPTILPYHSLPTNGSWHERPYACKLFAHAAHRECSFILFQVIAHASALILLIDVPSGEMYTIQVL